MLHPEIARLVKEHYQTKLAHRAFIPGKDRVHYAGRVFDAEELLRLVESSLDFWLIEGRFAGEFPEKNAGFFGRGKIMQTNSGQSSCAWACVETGVR